MTRVSVGLVVSNLQGCRHAQAHSAVRAELYTLGRPGSSHSFKLSKLKNGGELDQPEHIAVIS